MLKNIFFPGSKRYWENRYAKEGNSGPGSYGEKAKYKAGIINQFISDNHIDHVIELGCGDGNQLSYFKIKNYTGIDISKTSINICKEKYKNSTQIYFFEWSEFNFLERRFDLALSLDVIYHLIEDRIFTEYMNVLFGKLAKYVIIYAWDEDSFQKFHVKHRKFSTYISAHFPEYTLLHTIKKEGFCDFWIYKLTNDEKSCS